MPSLNILADFTEIQYEKLPACYAIPTFKVDRNGATIKPTLHRAINGVCQIVHRQSYRLC